MKKVIRSIVILGIMFLISGCECPFGRYKPVELVKGKKPEPLEDYRKLDALFRKHGGKLAGPEDKTVKWKDTAMYRIFEFKNHTVAIFPFNWNENHFDLYLIAGHFKKYDDLLNDIGLDVSKEPTVNISSNENSLLCSFDGLDLGIEYSEVYRDYILEKIDSSADYFNYKIKKVSFLPYADLSCNKDNFYIYMMLYNNIIYYIKINELKTTLSDYRLMNYKLAVLWEGEFEIPPPETETQKETVPQK